MPGINDVLKSARPRTEFPKQTYSNTSVSIDSSIQSKESVPEKSIREPDPSHEGNREQSSVYSPSSTMFSPYSFSLDELRSMILDQASRAEKIKELSALLRILVLMGKYQLDKTDHDRFVKLLDANCGERESWPKLNFPKPPIKFKDAVGRKFSFPWDICKTWEVCSTNGLYRMLANVLPCRCDWNPCARRAL